MHGCICRRCGARFASVEPSTLCLVCEKNAERHLTVEECNDAIDRHKRKQTMADAFVDIATELAKLDAKGAPHSPRDAYQGLTDHVHDLGDTVDNEDAHGAKKEATLVAALAVRLLLALPGGE